LIDNHPTMNLKIEFSGGLDLIFGGKKGVLDVSVPFSSDKPRIGELLPWMRENMITERPELFMKGETVRPGILVLINEVDWELSGMLDSELSEGDAIVFISTLHGG
jgi:ubiquitin related modifier 1